LASADAAVPQRLPCSSIIGGPLPVMYQKSVQA
jgi:hypothetical protein